MKKWGIIIVLAITANSVLAQAPQQVKNLATFGKVWGFLKYYHSEASKGKPDWDQELIKMIPAVKEAKDQQAFDKLLVDWYASLPKSKTSEQLTQPHADSITRVFDERDINKYPVPQELKQQLTKLYQYHLPDSSRYITNQYKQYHLDYILHTEYPFEKPDYPSEELRLLALFRYWNIINYFYPHKHINTNNWDKVLEVFIPRFVADKNADEYRNTFRMLCAQLNDSHSFFRQDEWDHLHQNLNMPFRVCYIKGKYVIGESRYDSLMKANNFKIGDEIATINNMPIAERVEQLTPLTSGTNKLSFYRNIANNLFKIDSNRMMQLTLKRNGLLINRSVKLWSEGELYQYRKRHAQKLWQDIGNGVWYVRICSIYQVDTLKRLFNDIKDAKTVIWDMRDYPSFQVVQAVYSGLYASPQKNNIDYNGLLFFPGAFVSRLDLSYAQSDPPKLTFYKGKMIVLVNEYTQSLAESVASELRSRLNTIIMGRQTAGTTGNITWVDFPGGVSASFTGVGVEGLNDSFKEKRGVKIDKEISLSVKKLTSADDYVLQEAIKEAGK